jgi:capsid portal protein
MALMVKITALLLTIFSVRHSFLSTYSYPTQQTHQADDTERNTSSYQQKITEERVMLSKGESTFHALE